MVRGIRIYVHTALIFSADPGCFIVNPGCTLLDQGHLLGNPGYYSVNQDTSKMTLPTYMCVYMCIHIRIYCKLHVHATNTRTHALTTGLLISKTTYGALSIALVYLQQHGQTEPITITCTVPGMYMYMYRNSF